MATFIGGRLIINGIDMSSSAARESLVETQVGGVRIQYQPGENLRQRQVIINGGSHLTLSPGSEVSMTMNGVRVSARNSELWINGQQVDFDGKLDPAVAAKVEERLSGLKSRFPGVEFAGDPAGVTIGDRVQIAAGAHIELTPGLLIDGDTRIGPESTISGGEIRSSKIDGNVSGGNVEHCELARGSTISGGNAEHCKLATGARISGGNAEFCTLKEGSRISGGNAEHMVLEPGSRISGGNAEHFTLPAGERISGGSHERGLNKSDGVRNSISVDGDLVVGDLIVNGRSAISLGNVAGSLVSIGNGNVVVRREIDTVGPGESVVGVQIGNL